jgi:hypothetical protein
MRRRTALLLLAGIAAGIGGFASAAADESSAGAIHIEYMPPKNPDHQILYKLLQERGALEKAQAVFSVFRLPVDVTLRTIGCDGVSNAWYQTVNRRPTISLCYEYLQEIWQGLPQETTAAGTTPVDALAGQFFFALAHELGHLSFDVYAIPVFGHEEDAADNFATYLMLTFREDGHRLIAGAAYSYNRFVRDYKTNAKATLPLAAFSSNHGQPEERFFNLLCIAYGSGDKRFADMVDRGWLPRSRARHCKYEYDLLQFAFELQVKPHIDQERARKVPATKWFDIAVPRPPGR